MLKQLFMALSRSRASEKILIAMPFGMRIANRFVAGYKLRDIIAAAEALQGRGFRVAADHLGEEVKSKSLVKKAFKDYEELIKALGMSSIKEPSISIKLSQLGLAIDYKLALQNARRIAKEAEVLGVRLEVDMEDSRYTDRTIKIYKELLKTNPATALALQANLHRTSKDLPRLIKLKDSSFRLVKGAYLENADIAFEDKLDVDRAYEFLLSVLLSPEARKNGVRPLIGTHDDHMMKCAEHTLKRNKWKSTEYEIEMLYGVRPKMQKKMLFEGHRVRVYTPYGDAWYPYLMRRLAERPANVMFIVKSFLRG